MKKVIVIGAGLGGLATAALLAKDGYDVEIYEKNTKVGGRANILKKDNFIFDMGPSWYMMPEVFDRFFKLFGKKTSDYYKLLRLNPRYRIFYGKNNFIDLKDNIDDNVSLFDSIEKGSGKKLLNYLDISKKLYNLSTNSLVYNNIKSPLTLLSKNILTTGIKILKTANIFQNFDAFVNSYVKDEKLKKVIEFPSVFLGCSPYNQPAFYGLINHADFDLGIWYPQGGIYELSKALEKLCKEYKVKINTNSEITKINIKDGRIKSINLGKKEIRADIVISNSDYHHTQVDLLENEFQTYNKKYWEKRTKAISAYMIYLGVKGKIDNLKHHNFFFGTDWPKGFHEVFEKPQWQTDPSYYVSCTSKIDSTVAPEGYENLFFLVPMAPGLDDNTKARESYFVKIIKHFEDTIGEKIDNRIVSKTIFSQRDFTDMFNAYQGTALGLAHTLDQSLFMRPRIVDKKVKGLYYVGQYTQPGIGMPLVIISAQIVEKEVLTNE